MSDFPKWIKPHPSHDPEILEKTREIHIDRVVGLRVLVSDAVEEAELLADLRAPKEDHKEEA